MTMTNNASMCSAISGGNCNFGAPWNPSVTASDPLIFFAAYNRQGANFGWSMSGSSGFQGILYTNGGYSLGNGTETMGSVFADYASVIGNGQFQVTNTPARTGHWASRRRSTTPSFAVAPRTWRQCPAATGCS